MTKTKIFSELESGVVEGFVTHYKQVRDLVGKLPAKAVFDSINKKVTFQDELGNEIPNLAFDLSAAGASDIILPFSGMVNTLTNTNLVVNTETTFQADSSRNFVYFDEGRNRFLYLDRTNNIYYTKWNGDSNSYNGKMGSDSYMDISIKPNPIPKESIFFINEQDDYTPYYFEYTPGIQVGVLRRVTSKATDVRTSEAITIAGGPLANNVVDSVDVWPSDWVDADGNKIIPAGKSLQEILTTFFLKEEPGTVSWSAISWSPKMNNPTVDVKVNGTSVKNKTVEVGTEVTIDASTTTGLQANTNVRKATLIVDPETNGYFEGDTWKNAPKAVSQNGNNPSGTLTVSNSLKIGSANGTIANNKFTAGSGTNTVTTTQTGYTVTCSKLADTTIYASTNTRKKITTNPAVLNDAYPSGASVHTTTPPNTTASASVTGARFMFWGADDGSATLNSAYIRANKKDSAATAAATKTVDAQGALRIWIALPSGRSLSNLYNSLGSDLGSVMGDVDSSKTASIEGANSFTAATYTLYVFESDSALNGDYTIVIK